MIKFISYDGDFPNLCRGVLTVELDGKIVRFGHHYDYLNFESYKFDDEDKNNPNYDEFWTSGGKICSNKHYDMWTEKGEWILNFNENNYPKEIKELLPKLIKIFNENVEFGCCGGCI